MALFRDFRIQVLFILCAVLCSIGNTRASTTSGREVRIAEDRHADQVLQHRYFFNYDLDSTHFRSSSFQVKASHEIFESIVKVPSLTKFTIRSRNQRPHISGYDTQQKIDTHTIRMEPNITDKETVVNLAKMTSDAYIYDPREPDWLNTSLGFNFTHRFGWLDEGLRGHIFTTEDYSTVVISYKGTTIDPRDRISGRDRINDVRLYGCCCGAQNPWRYAPVCDCSTGHNQCDSDCLTKSLLQNDTYYDAALYIFDEIRSWYPDATFWTVGHSLGGSMASLVGLTLDIPAVTFESPPERLPAGRMGLIPAHAAERYTAHHFGNTGDPIYMGECNGLFSSCAAWGFVFDSKCFTGSRCMYDTRKDKGWHSYIGNHRINYVIENVLEAYDKVPECTVDTDCVDCEGWNFS